MGALVFSPRALRVQEVDRRVREGRRMRLLLLQLQREVVGNLALAVLQADVGALPDQGLDDRAVAPLDGEVQRPEAARAEERRLHALQRVRVRKAVRREEALDEKLVL